MKSKELKAIAKKIAELEKQLSQCENSKDRKKVEEQIYEQTGKIKSLTDMMIIDDLVQEYLQKN